MKQNVSSLNVQGPTSNVGLNTSKISPNQPSNGKSVYILKNMKIAGPTINQADFTTASHSPRHMMTNDAKSPATTSGIPTLQFQSKTPRSFQSPTQKIQHLEMNKGKNAQTNPDFKEPSNKYAFGHLARSPDNRNKQQQQQQRTSGANGGGFSPLVFQTNKDKKNSKTPKSSKENGQLAPKRNANTSNFNAIEQPTRTSNQYKPAGRENMKPDTEPSTGITEMKKPQPSTHQAEINQATEQRVLAEIDLNSLKSTVQIVSVPVGTEQTQHERIQVSNTNPSVFPQETQNLTARMESRDFRVASTQDASSQQVVQKPQNNKTPKTSHACKNHPEKKAKYHSEIKNEGDIPEFFCSKCAIEVAQRREKVIEISGCTDSISSTQSCAEQEITTRTEPPSHSNNTQASAIKISPNFIPTEREDNQTNVNPPTSLNYKRRNEELINFTQRLGDLIERIGSLKNYAGHEKAKVLGVITHEKESIDACCKKLIETVNRTRDEIFKSLDSEQSNATQWFGEVVRAPSKFLDEITQIKANLEENMQNIAKNTEEKPYNQMMQKYEEKFDLFERVLSENEVALFEETSEQRTRDTIPKFKKNLRERVESTIAALSEDDVNVEQAGGDYLPCDEESKLNSVDTISSRQKSFNGSMTHNLTLVSFENKEIFENALSSSKDGDVLEKNSTCETVIEHDEEHAEIFGLKLRQKGLFDSNGQNPNRRSRYDELSQKEHFSILTVQPNSNKRLSEGLLHFIESKMNEEDNSPKENYQKSLFTSPNFKEI